MAIYKPDNKLFKATVFVKNLDTTEEGNDLIMYYIDNLRSELHKKTALLDQYKLFFKMLESLMPKHPKTLGR